MFQLHLFIKNNYFLYSKQYVIKAQHNIFTLKIILEKRTINKKLLCILFLFIFHYEFLHLSVLYFTNYNLLNILHNFDLRFFSNKYYFIINIDYTLM